MEIKKINEEVAIRHYIKHLEVVSKYQKANPEKMRAKHLRRVNKLKENGLYDNIKKQQHEYYINVIKPKRIEEKEAKKRMKQDQVDEEEIIKNF